VVFSERALTNGPVVAVLQALLAAWTWLLVLLPPSRALLRRLLPNPGH